MVNILTRILDSERNFKGFADLMITADRGFIQFLGPDFGFWLLRSSERGSQRCRGNFTFSLFCAVCLAVKKMTINSEALNFDVAISLLFFSLVFARFCFDRRWFHKYFVDSHPQR